VATADNDLIAEVCDEFAADAPIDERSGVIAHMKAMTVAAAAAVDGKVDERGYWKALNAIAGDEGEVGRRYADDDTVAAHCRSAAAIAGLAAELLRQRGVKRSDPSYADEYVAECEKVGKRYGLPYGGV